ncbi:MAG TPA: DUF6600 domain-containing protein [Patescibacteria group bacterium]|nr:DUF6600 domain-containing protein [Patescibacteria group bacterium]
MNTPRTSKGQKGWAAVAALFMALPILPTPATLAFGQSGQGGTQPAQGQVAEQEGSVYGRLRFIEGGLTLKRDNEVYTDLVINDPLTPGDVVSTAREGRAELQLADGSSIKLDDDSELVLQSLSDSSNQIENTTILQLGRGSMIIRADNMDSKEKRFQIDTDGASIFLLSDGLFRIDVRADGTTVVSSRRGVAEVMSQEVSSLVRSGERITARPDEIPGESRVFNTRTSDDFDEWSVSRDESLVRRARVDDEEPTALPEPVEPYSNELSYYGRWYNNPSYGWVWRPVGLQPDWQPYMYGRWTDCPTGLVWVSYEPWGWAPFHYGRWEFLVGNGWVWIPGHVFAGAYVAWSVSPGYFGWCPLGFYDYPVSYSFNLGFHRDPWIYINAQNIYARRVNTVCIRDVNVRRDIEHTRVIIRGRPIVDPRRVKDAPRLATELHNVAQDRRDISLDPVDPARRLPFRENERQKLVEQNRKHLREGQESPGTPVVRGGGAGRPVSVMPTDRRVNVPRARGAQPGTGTPGSTPGTPPAGYDRRRGRGGGDNGRPTTVAPRREPLREDSQPERVIPRIIPRPGSGASETPDRRPGQAPPRGNVRRQDPQQARPTPAPPRQSAAPAQERPRGGETARPAPPRQERPKPNGNNNNGGNNGGGNKGGGNNGGGHRHKD